MKQLCFLFLLFAFSNSYCQSLNQHITIFLTPEFMNAPNMVGFLVSNQEGEIVFEEFAPKENYTGESSISLPKVGDDQLMLTVIKEHNFQLSPVQEYIYHSLLSIHGLVDQMKIDNFLSMSEVIDYDYGELGLGRTTIDLNIYEIDEYKEIIVDMPRIDKYLNKYSRKFKRQIRKNGMINIEIPALRNTDIFFLIKANGEENYRYLYEPFEENASFDLDYISLPSNLAVHSIEFTDKERCTGYISATNEITKNNSYFYFPQKNTFDKKKALDLYLPESQFFSEFRVELSCYNVEQNIHKKYFHYGENLPDTMDIELHELTYIESDEEQITLDIFDREVDFYKVRFGLPMTPPKGYESSRLSFRALEDSEMGISYWKVIGINKEENHIVFPNFATSIFYDIPLFLDFKPTPEPSIELFSLDNPDKKELFNSSPNHIYKGVSHWNISGTANKHIYLKHKYPRHFRR